MKSVTGTLRGCMIWLVVLACCYGPTQLFAQDADDAGERTPKPKRNFAPRKFATDRVIIKYRAKANQKQVGQHKQKKGLRLKRTLSRRRRIELVQLPKGKSVRDALRSLKNDPEVEYAEPDYLIQLDAIPNDPKFNEVNRLWGLHNQGTSSLPADVDIDAPEGWDIRHSAPNTIVAVIDTGIDIDHPDLAANMWQNTQEIVNGIDDDGNGYIDDIHGINSIADITTAKAGNPNDDHGHGSHCAGTIGAVGNNGVGVTGVCWNVQLMALKFLDSSGSGYSSDAIECFEYAIANGASVISCSWGGGGYSQALYDVLNECRSKGIIVVCAAGNNGTDNDLTPHYPSSYALDNIVAVGASDMNGKEASFSCYGFGSVDVFAPGYSIYSCYKGGKYTTMSGTSMATPHVAGILALMREQYGDDDSLQIINRLYASVVPYKLNLCKARGMVNLANALGNPPNRPINDDLANYLIMGSTRKTVMDCTNVGATREVGEPDHAGYAGDNSVWAYWRAPVSGKVVMTTEDSTFDTLLSVYTGSRVSSLTLIAENDDISAAVPQSRVEFNAIEGTRYKMAIAGKNGAEGTVVLHINCPPPNDNFEDRQYLGSDLTYTHVPGTNLGATREVGEPAHAGQTVGSSIWYSWHAPRKRLCNITLEGSDFDTVMAVYKGTSLDNLELVASNDDVVLYEITHSAVEFVADADTEYIIAVDGWGGSAGNSMLTLDASVDQPPKAAFDVTDAGSEVPTVVLDGSDSYDIDGEVVEYMWTFPDGTVEFGKTVTMEVEEGQQYEVQLTVTDQDGLTATTTEVVMVTAEGVVPTGLVCHLRFDEGTGEIAEDASPNDHDGILAAKSDAELPTWIIGANDNALLFNGDNFVKLTKFPWDKTSDLLPAVSISLWLCPDQAVLSGRERFAFGKAKEGIALSQLEDAITFACPLFDARTGGTSIQKLSIPVPSLNEWHHVAGVVDTTCANGMKVYLDGQLMAEQDVSGLQVSMPSEPIYIGTGGPRVANSYFIGAIDEVGMYAKALSQSDVGYLSSGGDVGTAPGDTTPVEPDGPDTTAPTVPQGLAASVVSTSQIDLTWTASTDPVVAGQLSSGIAGYDIKRDGVKIATVSTTSYSDTGLTAGTTYSYTVVATDAAGNTSADSASATATTETAPVDLPVISVRATDDAASEPNALANKGKGKFKVYRMGNLSSELTVNYAVSGTAANGEDHETLTGSVTIPVDKGYALVVVKPLSDALDEDDESIVLTLTDAPTYTVDQESKTATVALIDAEYDSPIVSVKPLDDTASEPDLVDGQGAAKFIVYRTGSLGIPLTVNYTMTGTAVNGEDYVSCSGTLTIPVDRDRAVLKVRALDDELTEGTETVVFTLSADPVYQIDPEQTSATATIIDADATN